MKVHSVFVCQQCGAKSPKWVGRCPECGGWNTMVETMENSKSQSASWRTNSKQKKPAAKPLSLSEIKTPKKSRISSGIGEMDRVLGGGIVPGSVVLLAGEPGIGKSTLLLQLANSINLKFKILNFKLLYVSGEESLSQVKLRAERLGIKSDNLLFLAETDVDVIVSTIEQLNNETIKQLMVFVDSIQTLYTEDLMGTPGSVGQVRECANRLLKIAKSKDIPLFLIGHITKEGVIAGPKVLEHLVDTVLYLEGEKFGTARLLRATKNRFGPTDEVGLFQMTDKGMEEVANPSALFLAQKAGKTPGSVVVATLEGTRPLLVEIQALVVSSQLAVPRRVSQGIDYNRLQMIIAVLTKILRLPLGGFDIYVNVTGGLKIEEPAADLGVALAIYSSFKNLSFPAKTVCFGELGLLGEVREVGGTSQREKEARRLGFTNIISPKNYSAINQVVKQLT
jgi:DNA repair protein RadA/Sms